MKKNMFARVLATMATVAIAIGALGVTALSAYGGTQALDAFAAALDGGAGSQSAIQTTVRIVDAAKSQVLMAVNTMDDEMDEDTSSELTSTSASKSSSTSTKSKSSTSTKSSSTTSDSKSGTTGGTTRSTTGDTNNTVSNYNSTNDNYGGGDYSNSTSSVSYEEPSIIGKSEDGNSSSSSGSSSSSVVEKYTVTVTVSGDGGTARANPTSCEAGDTVELTATPVSGYELDKWSSDDVTISSDNSFKMPANDVDITATFKKTEEKVTVSFDKNGGSGSMSDQEVTAGEATTLNVNEFTRDGYTFDGWNTEKDGSGKSYADEGTITTNEDVTLYAQWEKSTATVKFDANGGSGSMSDQTVTAGKATALNANTFTRDGYTFDGWNTEKDGSGESFADKANITTAEDVTLYAQWKEDAKDVTITFDANGGSGSMDAQKVTSGKASKLNANKFTRDGYTFNGWNTAKDGKGESYADGASINVTKNTTLYAQWIESAKTCVVTFDANGGSGTMNPQTVASGKATTLASNLFTRSGYTFNGWNTAADGSGKSYADNDSINTTSDVTLYAQWKEATKYCNITFIANGGAGAMDVQTVVSGVATQLAANAFTRDGYTFNGWNTAADGSGAGYGNQANITTTNDVVLYAMWAKNKPVTHVITFDPNGGKGTMGQQVIEVGVATKLNPNKFSRSGYTFAGWNTAPDGSGYWFDNKETVKLNSDVTLYAQWTKNGTTSTTKKNNSRLSKTGDVTTQIPIVFLIAGGISAIVVGYRKTVM